MSASLVGSEMCIRDRHQRFLPTSAGLQGFPASCHVCVMVGLHCEVLGSCLLYTSDAADDM
eukprot:14387092-Alexandrium_andersonii.AAC.1